MLKKKGSAEEPVGDAPLKYYARDAPLVCASVAVCAASRTANVELVSTSPEMHNRISATFEIFSLSYFKFSLSQTRQKTVNSLSRWQKYLELHEHFFS